MIFLKLGQWKRDQKLLCYLQRSKLQNGVKYLLPDGFPFDFAKNIFVKTSNLFEIYGGVNNGANDNPNPGWIRARKLEHGMFFSLADCSIVNQKLYITISSGTMVGQQQKAT